LAIILKPLRESLGDSEHVIEELDHRGATCLVFGVPVPVSRSEEFLARG
jgi:hypothetical protein